MAYNLGIDIGITSIGFAGVDLKKEEILFCGVHMFDAAEDPKTGASLAEPRRNARGQRRIISRRGQRKRAIRRLLIEHGFQHVEAIEARHERTEKGSQPLSVWDWRKAALERKLTDTEFVRVLYHIAKRRGFQSNRKNALEGDEEGKKALSGAKTLQEAMKHAGALTVGAYLSTLPKKRNGDGSYDCFVTRDLLREEIKQIFAAQQALGNSKATEALRSVYEDIAFSQRPLQSSEHLVGSCTFEPTEKRAPKFSYTAELFILWSKLNNTKIKIKGGDERFLTLDEKNGLAALAHKNKSGVSYKQARKELILGENEFFNSVSYKKVKDADDTWEKLRETAENKPGNFLKLPGHHALKEALDTDDSEDWQRWINADRDRLDEIARILSFHEDQKQINDMLASLGLSAEQRAKLPSITSFKGTVNLSLKAIRAILPYMQRGLSYDKACKEAGYNQNRKDNKGLSKVPVFEDIRNPVVNRALAQTRKVINAILRKHGEPGTIIVELARDLGRSAKERKEIEREQKKNQAYRDEAREEMAKIMRVAVENVSGEDILKYRLWKEQDHRCPYSDEYITPEKLADPVATQIDHIIPYSLSYDDSYMNKVLCRADMNQQKGDQIPYDYLGQTSLWESLETFAKQLPFKKAERLLLKAFDIEKEKKWKDRALNDTRYIARTLKNHLEQSLNLGEGNRVQTRNGALIAHLRGIWGLPLKDRSNDRHHAVDAIVVACSTQSMVQKLSRWNKYEARTKKTIEKPTPPKPWDNFREDVKAAVDAIFVSRLPVRKVTGAAHEETIRSIRKNQDGQQQIIQRVKLKDLKPEKLENIVDKQRNIKLYNVLKERLDAYGGDPKKAFATPIYMPTNDSLMQGPQIHSVRIITNEKNGININQGLASNGDMVRVDVFQKKGKYYLVPVYAHHFASHMLPNKAIIAKKPESEWEEMEEKYFLFSLYKNDLIKIKSKKEEIIGYYAGAHRGTGAISVRAHDRDSSFGKDGLREGIGIKTLLGFEKHTVDYFGNIYPHKSPGIREKRVGLTRNHNKARLVNGALVMMTPSRQIIKQCA